MPTEPDIVERLKEAAELQAAAQAALDRILHGPMTQNKDADHRTVERFEDFARSLPLADIAEEVEGLRAIVDRLPKTADGVQVYLYDTVWTRHGEPDYPFKPFKIVSIMYRGTIELELVSDIRSDWSDICNREAFDCYSTPEAAALALSAAGGDK